MSRFKKCLFVLTTSLLVLAGIQYPVSAASYNLQQASKWAAAHAQDDQPNFNGCAWFVSKALWQAGLRADNTWHGKGYRPGFPPLPGTKTATVAEELYNHLKGTKGLRVLEISDRYDPRRTSVPEARPGNVIAYDWEGDGHINHVSLVTGIAPGNYPEVSEWGSAPDGKKSPYQKRGWSWSANSNKWQRAVHPGVRAYLVRL